MFEVGLMHFMVVSALLVAAGIAAILTKRNAIGLLMGVELVLNAAGINFVAFNVLAWQGKIDAPAVDGVIFAIFLIVLAAAEAAVALAIFLNFYNTFSSIDVDRAAALKG